MVIATLTLVLAFSAPLLAVSPGRDWPLLLVVALLVTVVTRRQLRLRSRRTSAGDPLLVFEAGGIKREELSPDRLPRLHEPPRRAARPAGGAHLQRVALPASLGDDVGPDVALQVPALPGFADRAGTSEDSGIARGVFPRDETPLPAGKPLYDGGPVGARGPRAGGVGIGARHRNGDSEENALTMQLLPGSLTVMEGVDRGTEIRFVRHPGAPTPEFTLGRAPNDSLAHIQVRGASVSRTHARMRYLGDAWEIANLSATNPARVNGVGLSGHEQAQRLSTGDIIELGEVVLRYRSS